MAQVTIELRELLKVQNFKLFDFDYPVISQEWKAQFEQKFIDTYFFDEIGSETIDRFKQRLKARLNLIMPKYIERSQKIAQLTNPLELEKTVHEEIRDLSKTRTRTNASNVELDSQTTTTDYPQHTVIEQDIPTAKTADNSSSSGLQNENITDTDTGTVTKVLTKTGGLKELKEWLSLEEHFTNAVINECRSLFILVY